MSGSTAQKLRKPAVLDYKVMVDYVVFHTEYIEQQIQLKAPSPSYPSVSLGTFQAMVERILHSGEGEWDALNNMVGKVLSHLVPVPYSFTQLTLFVEFCAQALSREDRDRAWALAVAHDADWPIVTYDKNAYLARWPHLSSLPGKLIEIDPPES